MPSIELQAHALMRDTAEWVLSSNDPWRDAFDAATLPFVDESDPPEAAAIIKRSNVLSILHFASHIVKSPGQPVPPIVSDDVLRLAGERTRMGTSELSLRSYRVGQGVGWRIWMECMFELAENNDALLLALDLSSSAIDRFVDETVTIIEDHIKTERIKLSEVTPSGHHDLVSAILDGQRVDPDVASRRLGYRLDGMHHALILWANGPGTEQARFDALANAIFDKVSGARLFWMMGNPSSLWIWSGTPVGHDVLEEILPPDFAVATGAPRRGQTGFCASHAQALKTQRAAKAAGKSQRIYHYEDERLFQVLMQDVDAFDTFARETLGALYDAGPVLQNSLYAYICEGCNLARTAQSLGVHRNTLQKRVDRAKDLLPAPFAARSFVDVAAALRGLF